MRIAITVDPEIPIPPVHYGGVERIVEALVNGLVRRGHQITLFAHPASRVPCDLRPYPGAASQSKLDSIRNMTHVSREILRGKHEVVHSFGRLAYLLPLLPLRIPKIMSYQRIVTPSRVAGAQRLAHGTITFTACSRQLVPTHARGQKWEVIYNAAPLDTYQPREEVSRDAPLVFLGRIEHIKGTHLAIEVARRSGRSLIIAGNKSPGSEHSEYFDREIAPHIDGERVQYMGPVNDTQKNELLGRAFALLMPILWEEPFGIVMAEALACGTPVIGLRRGSVPEVVSDGVTGFVCDTLEEMVNAIPRVRTLHRQACRADMEQRFSDEVMVSRYENLYHRVIRGSAEQKVH